MAAARPAAATAPVLLIPEASGNWTRVEADPDEFEQACHSPGSEALGIRICSRLGREPAQLERHVAQHEHCRCQRNGFQSHLPLRDRGATWEKRGGERHNSQEQDDQRHRSGAIAEDARALSAQDRNADQRYECPGQERSDVDRLANPRYRPSDAHCEWHSSKDSDPTRADEQRCLDDRDAERGGERDEATSQEHRRCVAAERPGRRWGRALLEPRDFPNARTKFREADKAFAIKRYSHVVECRPWVWPRSSGRPDRRIWRGAFGNPLMPQSQDAHPSPSRTMSAGRFYLSIARRRRVAIILSILLPVSLALAYSLLQQPVYQATARVLLSRQSLANIVTGRPDPTGQVNDFIRIVQTQADLARTPEIAQQVLRRTGIDATPQQLLDSSNVEPSRDADLLTFHVVSRNKDYARRLTTAYAEGFTEYRRALDTSSLRSARTLLNRRIVELERSPDDNRRLINSLADKEQELRTLETLQTSNVTLVRRASRAEQVAPNTRKNLILGLLAGLALAAAVAAALESLDNRVRSPREIEERLGVPAAEPRPAAAQPQRPTLDARAA